MAPQLQGRPKKRKLAVDASKVSIQNYGPVHAETFTSTSASASTGITAAVTQRIDLEPPTKRFHLEDSLSSDILSTPEPTGPGVSEAPDDANTDIPSSKPQGASRFMEEFLPFFPKCLDHILASETDPHIGLPCSCGKEGAVRTCLCNDCTFFEACCGKCFIESHISAPLHWAEVWNGSFFERRDISTLGHVITIGHDRTGQPCPHGDYQSPLAFILADITGIHNTKVVFCACIGVDTTDRVQPLLKAKIFPATVRRPELGFTFNLLRDFHLQTLTSKKSPFDYMEAVRSKSNNAFLHDVPDPYQQFLKVQRIWRVLSLLRRSGQVHGIDEFFPFRPPGNVNVPCFSCPEPGFNVPDEQWDLDDEEFRHINMLFLMEDGHFGLHQFAKPGVYDPNDTSLIPGQGLFPDDKTYNEFVFTHVANSEEKSTCSKFNAVEMQDKIKLAGCRITGAIGIACGRKGVFYALVDMQKGERFGNGDYGIIRALRFFTYGRTVTESLRGAKFFRHILLTYDVACQFYVKLKERFQEYMDVIDLADIIDFIHVLVPKLHLNSHKVDCRIRFSLNYFKGAGRSHGEGIEQAWAESKQSGGSTRHMNHGHRHDTLNDFHIYWNWDKVRRMASSLKTQLLDARIKQNEKVEFFLSLSEVRGRDLVESWSEESTDAVFIDGEWQSVYQLHLKKLPSQKMVFQSLEAAEKSKDDEETIDSRSTCAHVINAGVKLQQRQWALHREGASKHLTDEKIQLQRDSLSTDLRRWQKHQVRTMPLLEHLIIRSQTLVPEIEKATLFLPSDVDVKQWTKYGLTDAGALELKLREGQANDAVAGICNSITHQMVLKETKNRAARGVTQNTRAMSYINGVKEKRGLWAERYREARQRILKLKGEKELEDFPPLKEENMYAKNAAEPHGLGDGSRTDSWIWTYGRLRGLSDAEKEEFIAATEKVQWFRARADMERWVEEVELLEEEFRRASSVHVKGWPPSG